MTTVVNVEEYSFGYVLVSPFNQLLYLIKLCLHLVFVGIFSFDNLVEVKTVEESSHFLNVLWNLLQIKTVGFSILFGISNTVVFLNTDEPGHAYFWHKPLFSRDTLFLYLCLLFSY